MGRSTSDMIYVIFGAIMFGAAVSLLIVFSHTTQDGNTLVAKRVAEKQSIYTAVNTDIDTLPAHNIPITYTAEQVYYSIIAVNEDETEVKVGSFIISADDIKAAKTGDERASKEIRDAITSSKYTLKTIYDTDATRGDFPSKMEFKRV